MTDADLLALIYEAAATPDKWVGVAEALSACLGGRASVLYDRPMLNRSRPLGVNAVQGYNDAAIAAMQDHYRHIDVRIRSADRLTPGQIYFDEQDIPFAEIVQTEIHNDFYRPQGVGHVCGVILARRPDQHSILSIHRAAELGAFQDRDHALLTQLTPHLLRSWHIISALRRHQEDAAAFGAAIDVTQAMVFVLGRRAQLRHMSRTAEALVRKGNRLRVQHGRLVALDPGDDAALQALVTATIDQPALSASPPPASLVLRGEPRLALFAVRPPGPAGETALLFANDPIFYPAPNEALLRSQFGFTHAEARAAAGLTEGVDAPDLADRFGVSVNTMRSQIKSAMSKARVNSQTALAVVVVRSLAVLRAR